jgi:hypothetical protein
MSSVKAFENIYQQFLDDLLSVYPDNAKAKEARAAPITRATLDRFMKYAQPRSGYLTQRKKKGFFDPKNRFMVDNGVFDVMNTTSVSDKTVDAVWNYVNNMYMLGMSMSMIPPEMLAMFEQTADKFAKEAADGGEMTEEKLMSSMQKMMAGLMAGKNLGQ